MKRVLLIGFCFLLVVGLVGCSGRGAIEDIAAAMTAADSSLGDVSFFSLAEEKGSVEYLSDEMLLSLYGFDRSLVGLSGGAVCLSPFYYPFEIAVFECESTLCAEDVALSFNNRIELLRKSASVAAPFCDMTADEYRAYIDDARVLISGRYVALIIASDTRAVVKEFLRLS